MLHFIINPSSSSGSGRRIWEQTEDLLQERRAEYTCHFLEKNGDAQRIARKLTEGFKPCTMVVVGGDGTINEVLAGMSDFSGIRFTCIPTGSGNDFARALHLPKSPKACVDMILNSQRELPIHIGVAGGGRRKHYFAVSSGMGFDAEVCHISLTSGLKSALNKLHIGKLVYLLGTLRLLRTIQPADVTLVVDETQRLSYRKVWFVAAMNMPYEGGGFKFCPNAQPEDGELDVIVVNDISKREILRYLPLALKGKHTGKSGVHILRCHSAVLRANRSLCTHTDGEHLGFFSEMTYTMSEQTLTLILPEI